MTVRTIFRPSSNKDQQRLKTVDRDRSRHTDKDMHYYSTNIVKNIVAINRDKKASLASYVNKYKPFCH
jgi:hypothetical protein